MSLQLPTHRILGRTYRAAAAIVLATCLLSPLSAEAGGPNRMGLVTSTKQLAGGSFKDGPKHTWHAIKSKPGRYGLMLLGLAGLGAGAKLAGIDPMPWAVGLSTGTLGWSTWKTMPQIKAAKGAERLRLIGANVIWPTLLAVGSTAAGLFAGHGPEGAAGAHASLGEAAYAGGQSAVIGIDVPTIAQTVLDQPAKGAQPAKH